MRVLNYALVSEKNSVLSAERDFYSDQRSERCIVIARLGEAGTKANKKKTKGEWQELGSIGKIAWPG